MERFEVHVAAAPTPFDRNLSCQKFLNHQRISGWKSRAPTNANGDLEEADEVGEDEEGSGVVDPLQETKEDEGAAVDDEAGREDRLHPPYWKVFSHQRP